MAYLVLARKYRPRRFEDMVGQTHVARTLGHALESGRVHHAYLFSGVRGLGKTTAARIVARALVCSEGPRPDPCDACDNCKLALEGGHPDIVEIDGASHNKVDDVRDLRERVYYMPQIAARKVYIVDEVHMLSTSAFNALLKTLEEPPEHVHFLFATTEVHKLPATILSRVCRLDFRRVAEGPLCEHLARIAEREGIEAEPGALRLVARASEGSVRDAMTLLDQVIAFASGTRISEADAREVLGLSEPERIADLVDACIARDPAAALAVLDDLLAAGREVAAIAVGLLEHLRTLAVFVRCGPEAAAVTEGERARLAAQAEGLPGPSWVQGWFDRLAHALSMLPGHPAPRLLVEMAVLDLAAGEPVEDVLRLAERLEAGAGPSVAAPAQAAAEAPRPAPRRAREPAPRRAREPAPPRPPAAAAGDEDPDAAALRALLEGGGPPPGPAASPRAPRASRRRSPPAADDEPDPEGAGSSSAASSSPLAKCQSARKMSA